MAPSSACTLLPAAVFIALLSGCGSARQTETGAVPAPRTPGDTTATAEPIDRAPGQSIEQILMGRFPGVEVARTSNGGLSIRIRGVSSFMSSNEPLFVLDGVPFQPGPGGTLTGINPYDIASIEVLKNPADVAIYGVRGVNGVIVIKTKRPGQ